MVVRQHPNFAFHLLKVALISSLALHSVLTLAPTYYGADRPALEYELPPLEYGFYDLEPFIDGETVRIHYQGHHAKYTEKLNIALKQWRKQNKQASRISLVDLLRNLTRIPPKWRDAIRNNGGGYVNHNLYWAIMSPNPDNEDRKPSGFLMDEIRRKWTTFLDFKDMFANEAVDLFGSGYVWLCRNQSNNGQSSDLVVITTANQDTPLSQNLFPILVIDVWEHAYYLKYRNQRLKYVNDWWKVVDWNAVAKLDSWWKGMRLHDEL